MESYYYKLQLLNNNQVETVFFIFIVKMTSAKQLETIFVELFVEKSTYNQTLFFQNLYQVFQNPSRFLKPRIFGSIFIKLKVKSVLDSIKRFRRYCKVTLNMFFNKNIFVDEKKNYK